MITRIGKTVNCQVTDRERVTQTKLAAHDLQKLYKELMESGRTNRKSGHGNPGLSSTTVRSLHLMLHNALNRAVKERLILRNPTEDCIAPKVQKFEMQILKPEHIKIYLNAADKRGLLPMFYLKLVSGLRKGELTALLWSDLDIEDKTISVSKQYVKNPNGELTLSRPKTETSVRKVSIPQETVDLLIAEHKKHPSNPYMFPSPVTGEMYYPDSIVNLHKKILKDAGLPYVRFYDLRHPHVKHTTKIYLGKSRTPQAIKNGLIVWDSCFGLLHPHGALCRSLYGRFW